MSISLDLGFLSLILLLDGPDLLVGHEDGRVLFTAAHAGCLAPAHLRVEPATLPSEDTDTVRFAIVRAVNEARGLAPAQVEPAAPRPMTLDLGFLTLRLLLEDVDLVVHHEDGRVLFTAIHAGRLAPAHLRVEPTTLPWEDTDTVRLAIVRSVNEARGLAPARPVTLGRAGVAGDFFLARSTAQDRRDAQQAE